MAVFDIDTDELNALAGTASSANDLISEALQTLQSVTTHNDWQCAERTRINNYILQNRQMASTLQQNAAAFYQAISKAAELAYQSEQSYLQKQNELDDLVGRIENVVPGISQTGSVDGGAVPLISDFKNVVD